MESGKSHASLNQIHVDLTAELHTILELMLIITFSTFTFNILLNSIDLRLILDEFLFNVIKSVVDLTLQDLVLLCIVFHGMISDLFGETILILLKEFFDSTKSMFLFFKLTHQVIGLRKFIRHVIFHRCYFLLSLLHFFVDSSLQILNFIKVTLNLGLLDF